MLEALRQEVWECNLELPKYKLVVMTSGNVSGRDPTSGLIVIKPSGYSYEKLTPADMVVVDLAGEVIEGRLKPSIDTDTHLHVYRHRSDVFGICHTHSTYCSVFAALGKPIPPCLTASAMLGGSIPLGGYVPIGGEQIGEEIVAKIGDKSAIIMQNHGVFTIDKDARRAVKMAIEVEEIARITYFALLLGKPIILTEQQVQEIWEMYNLDYGQS